MLAVRHRALLLLVLAALFSSPPAPHLAVAQEGEEAESAPEESEKKPERPLTPDEKYIREHLKEYIFPSTMQFLDDGQVKLEFNFREKKEEHANIFSTRVGAKMKEPFRWTIPDEEYVQGGDKGLRVSNRGMALLNVWFTDDVEAEMEFLQYINHKSTHVAAIVFSNDRGSAIGSNYGSQLATFSRGSIRKRQGKPQAAIFSQIARIKLRVKDGVFEAHRQGRKKAATKYPEKSFGSGRIGIVWGGSISGIIPKLTVTGKLDRKKMLEVMKKYFGDD